MVEEKEIANMSFEAALEELEAIVNKLEGGNTPLEEAIRFYQRGNQLKSHCESTLKNAEERISKITLDQQGAPTGSKPLTEPPF